MNLFDIRGKVALVTGASKGLGKAMAMGLAKAGADLALCARSLDDLERSRAEAGSHGVTAKAYRMDVLARASIREAVDSIVRDFGRIDILVNNAGVNVRKPVTQLAEEEWDLVLDPGDRFHVEYTLTESIDVIDYYDGTHDFGNLSQSMQKIVLDNIPESVVLEWLFESRQGSLDFTASNPWTRSRPMITRKSV